ncbi:MAG: DegT/DnrJ/EryC1/StrS family aminotransferase [Acidobacteriia bacterium]|nr:DegT/DnrJ/EryC1/StrS family aminotransferase [Terriglobia bacterium]
MNVPYFDLKMQYASLRQEILDALDRVCQNASFILGEEVSLFEREFASFCETKHCVAMNTGTSALHIALLASGVAPGDEVITSPNTFIATAEAISYTGAKPVFVDIDPATANLDPRAVEAALTPRTRAIVPVHLYGLPADLDSLLAIADRHKLVLIEDACQAHGARYRGKRIGGFGKAAAFSFYPGKNLGAYGEGGALTTNDDSIAAAARILRDHGQVTRYYHDFVGFNYRMDGFQGAVLRVKLRHLEAWNARRRELSALYRKLLAGSLVQFPQAAPHAESSHHLFVVYVENRDAVRAELEKRGVATAIHYPVPVHLQKAYAPLAHRPGSFPHTERACSRVFSMPLFPEMTNEQAQYAAQSLLAVVSGK